MKSAWKHLHLLRYPILPIALLIVLLDQGSKLWIVNLLRPGEDIPVIPGFFSITLTHNPGIAFGFLRDVPDPYRIALIWCATGLALATVIYFLLFYYFSDRIAQFALALVIGGAFGNVIDRLRLGSVIDFLDFNLIWYRWPAFNVADSAVCIGVVILLFRPVGGGFRSEDRSAKL